VHVAVIFERLQVSDDLGRDVERGGEFFFQYSRPAVGFAQ
jgi:hypothetical protein